MILALLLLDAEGNCRDLQEKNQFHLGYGRFEMHVSHQSKDAKGAVGYMNLGVKKKGDLDERKKSIQPKDDV